MNHNKTLFRLERLTRAIIHSRPELKNISFKQKDNRQEWGYYPTPEFHVIRIVEILTAIKADKICDLGAGTGLLLAQIQVLLPEIKVSGIENEHNLVQFAEDMFDINTVLKGDLLKMNFSNSAVRDCHTFYMWEPITNEEMAQEFVNQLTSYLQPNDVIIYQCSGKIGEFLAQTRAFQRHPDLVYKEPHNGKKSLKFIHFATNQLYVFQKK